ncbi:HK97-gp10 family putative phage morphogenesis protein [Neptunicella sp.]|uniref:HK97-gp10 family putative phage morphogenesis protein n=1 Tax=Neptunicella sp. TaxID=2125986 RepID=UPI003F69225A
MYKVEGLAQLQGALVQLSKSAGQTVLAGALRDAARPIVRDARTNVARKTGALAKSIRTEVFRNNGTGRSNNVVSLSIGYHKSVGWRARFIEKGTKPHRIPNEKIGRGRRKRKNTAVVAFGGKVYKSVQHPGIKAQPTLLPAFERGQRQALTIFKQRLYQRIILQSIKKYGKRA